MYCNHCGKEVDNKAVVCIHCGCSLEKEMKTRPEDKEAKTGIGVVCGLFLGLIGLIIGVLCYKEGTIARKTFMKGWGIAFGISVVAGIIVGAVYGAALGSMLY